MSLDLVQPWNIFIDNLHRINHFYFMFRFSMAFVENEIKTTKVDTFMLNPNDTARETPYYFGVDPVS